MLIRSQLQENKRLFSVFLFCLRQISTLLMGLPFCAAFSFVAFYFFFFFFWYYLLKYKQSKKYSDVYN
jgi:hypothetical protein